MVIQLIGPCTGWYRRKKLQNNGFTQINKKKWEKRITDPDAFSLRACKRLARRLNLKYNQVEERFTRSTNYRKEYFKKHPGYGGIYFCAYCSFPHTKQGITIDHVIPVHAAENSKTARHYLKMKGISVNDNSNLVPCCKTCNNRKGKQVTPYWLIKAKLSRIPFSWVTVWVVRAMVLYFVCNLIFH